MKYEVWQKENEPEETTLVNVKNKRKYLCYKYFR